MLARHLVARFATTGSGHAAARFAATIPDAISCRVLRTRFGLYIGVFYTIMFRCLQMLRFKLALVRIRLA